MAIYKHRVQAVLDEEQYDLLQSLAQERETTVSGLIREAVQVYYVADAVKARRMAALRGLYAMGQEAEARGEVMPDWEELEEEIVQAVMTDDGWPILHPEIL
ncbi:MAG: ribbon-helix-helix protein, CopG family [Caldilineaceae bacterium]|nr:ribbon-helix-helix protein, CopG family [Caldilineaceae bacterium]MBP8108648.1 ribbon-helix-helix protein, CopG family [Caldilineaceae bacterium]MBP8123215.1 ribbon-helix-helix protein, CopG family [Caldilineaceae bacterium]MBP9073270.1 ribbon-helix-helix protein, CopG family [Caldilineaceae bacterium]